MDVPTFYEFLRLVGPHLRKNSIRPSICPEQRFAITLSLQSRRSTAHMIVKETCSVIAKVLMLIYLKPPTEVEWKEICTDFLNLWNLPNCVEAIDGKHIMIQALPNSGSMYFNYKKTLSLVLMAACNARYRFMLFDVDAYGSDSEGGILSRSTFGKALYKH
ncbi:PREDICTED: uncharacterized protein LOC105143422 isoform X1 [Acromyrmex echinatior]|uniref:uncharacterized protein LOC105143422 isoform X1 n=1 Tax=Acromyrmex echinatior TaxID=103372 RepID=UPI0005810116|nr:PREDICTED: uncharacterized protein LOC105143422 isoform X1 [Acromyrmex echinatior]